MDFLMVNNFYEVNCLGILAVVYTGLSLKVVGLSVAVAVIFSHLFFFAGNEEKFTKVKSFCRAFPRHRLLGIVLTIIAALWFMYVIKIADMQEFNNLKTTLLIATPVMMLLAIFFVEEFLAVRSLGAVLLLLAGWMLDAAFLQPPSSRILLSSLAYFYIIAAMFFVGLPWVLRDGMEFLFSKGKKIWNLLCLFGVFYGTLIAICALLWW